MQQQAKNRAPARIQISAEQLVRAAREHQVDDEKRVEDLKVATRVTDDEELRMHQAEKRREFETKLRHTMVNAGAYVRYAKWEESQLEFRRARSIFERALEGDHRDPGLWIKYAEFEMRNQFVNHARNVLDRAVQHLPRANKLWFKYVAMEETLEQFGKCRAVFERWMRWQPEEQAWSSYVGFENRRGNAAQAREVLEHFCGCFPRSRSYIKYARWEEGRRQLALARRVFERALEELDPSEAKSETLFIAFAKFEERCKEFARARAIYKQALDFLPKRESHELYKNFVSFERQNGDRESIELILMGKRRTQFEADLKTSPSNYDLWFDYIRLEEARAMAEAITAKRLIESTTSVARTSIKTENSMKDKVYATRMVIEARDKVRAVYSRAVACVPPDKRDKLLWKRYIYLWINWALFEELQCGDVAATREVYHKCLRDTVPHKHFTFSKVWIMAAHFELRQLDLGKARALLGEAIGRCPRDKLFKAYIQLELQLGNVDRCRALYSKYLEFAPYNCFVWQKYAELEASMGETVRARAIYELAVKQPALDMPETLWKRFIDFEVGLKSKNGKRHARALYGRLLERTDHVKVWASFAKFEALICEDPIQGRKVFEQAYSKIKQYQAAEGGENAKIETKEDRALLLRAWLEVEQKVAAASENEDHNAANVKKLQGLQPKKVTRRRELEGGDKEYYADYIFMDDPQKGSKLLKFVKNLKSKKNAAEVESVGATKRRKLDIAVATVPALDDNEIDLDDL